MYYIVANYENDFDNKEAYLFLVSFILNCCNMRNYVLCVKNWMIKLCKGIFVKGKVGLIEDYASSLIILVAYMHTYK